MPGDEPLACRLRIAWLLAGSALAGTLLVSGCTSSGPAGGGAPSSSAVTTSSASSRAVSAAENACDSRPDASGDMYVRIIAPGVPPQAQELGGEWRWDSATGKCLTSVQLMIATAPMSSGDCTQVGYVADNPGYDVNAVSAPPLKHVVAQKGPAC
jgi:hypothetical protein